MAMSILLFLLVLTVLVLVHEAGHFFMARWSGVKVDEFGVGFPPRALGFLREKGVWRRVARGVTSLPKTIFSLNWLPLGGFVRLKGEQGEAAQDPDSFQQATFGRKLAIISAGVIMNWLLAWGIFSTGYAVGIPMDKTYAPPQAITRDAGVIVSFVLSNGPAEKSGLTVGDRILAVNEEVLASDMVLARVKERSSNDAPVRLEVLRKGEEKTLEIMPELLSDLGRRGIGVGFEERVIARLPLWLAPLEGFRTTFLLTKAILGGFVELLRALTGPSQLAGSVSGPVGIAVMTGRIAEEGVWALARFAGILSINLAIVNFLPIPALDGGRALFLIIERLRGKKHRADIEAMIHSIGFLVLLGLILLVTFQDLRQYGPAIWQGLFS